MVLFLKVLATLVNLVCLIVLSVNMPNVSSPSGIPSTEFLVLIFCVIITLIGIWVRPKADSWLGLYLKRRRAEEQAKIEKLIAKLRE